MKIMRNSIFFIITIITIIFLGYYFTTKHIDNRKVIKAVIFDMDGTTIDTDLLWKAGNRLSLEQHASHLSSDEIDTIINSFGSMPIYDCWLCVQNHCSNKLSIDQIIHNNIEHLHALYQTQGIEFIPQFQEFYNKILKLGVKTAIASSSQQHTLNVIIEVLPSLQNYFGDHLYTADHVGKVYKPNPAVYLYAAQQLCVKPCDCIAIEDSASGIKAAKSAGMYCIGINTGKDRTQLQLADEIVENYEEINLDKFNFIITK